MAKTFQEIEAEAARTIQDFSNRQVDLSEGSVIRQVIKTLAAMQLQEDDRGDEIEQNDFLPTAKGEALDAKGYWLDRQGATRAKGFIIVENLSDETVELPNGALLAEPNSNALYEVIDSNIGGNRTVPPKLRTAVPIQAKQAGSEFNLDAGARLIPLNQPKLEARVGDGITLDGKSCGPLQGGRDAESDEAYRQRLLRSARHQDLPTTQWLEQRLLGWEIVNNAQVDTTLGGLVTILLDRIGTFSDQDLKAIRNDIQQFLSPGVAVAVKQARRINVSVDVTVFGAADNQSELSETIKAFVWDYTRSIKTGTAFNPGILQNQLQTAVPNAIVQTPATTIDIAQGDLVYPETINTTYVSNQ